MASSATEELEGLRGEVHAAQRRAAEAEAEFRTSKRAPERARGALVAYHEEVAAGDREPDAEEERTLREEVRGQDAAVTVRPVFTDGRVSDFETVNSELEGAGARRALEDRQAETQRFVDARLGDLLAERVGASLGVAERLRTALEALVAVDGEWSREIGAYRGLLALARRDELAEELPRRSEAQRTALAEWDDQLRDDPAALAPLPRFLLEPDDQAA